MKGKSALYALAVVVLMGTMGVAALADEMGTNPYGPNPYEADSAVSSQPEQGSAQSGAGEIREPVETGAIPDQSLSSADLHSESTDELPAVGVWGREYRPGVDGE